MTSLSIPPISSDWILPLDVTRCVFEYLSFKDLALLSCTCKGFSTRVFQFVVKEIQSSPGDSLVKRVLAVFQRNLSSSIGSLFWEIHHFSKLLSLPSTCSLNQVIQKSLEKKEFLWVEKNEIVSNDCVCLFETVINKKEFSDHEAQNFLHDAIIHHSQKVGVWIIKNKEVPRTTLNYLFDRIDEAPTVLLCELDNSFVSALYADAKAPIPF